MPEKPEHSRPLSPHLQIYKPQLTSVLSITHRGSGVFMSFGTLLLALCLTALALGPEPFAAIQDHFQRWYGLLLLGSWAWAFYYHMCNGIRHLFWDGGMGFSLGAAYRSGAAVIIASLLLTLLTLWRLLAQGLTGGAA